MKFVKKHPFITILIVEILLFLTFAFFCVGDNVNEILREIVGLALFLFPIISFAVVSLIQMFKDNKPVQPIHVEHKELDVTCKLSAEKQNIYYEICSIISNNDKDIMDKLKYCFESPNEFYQKYKEQYFINRDYNYIYGTKETIYWLFMVDLLIGNNYANEVDWKLEFDEFKYFLSKTKNFPQYNFDKLNPTEMVESWIREINKDLKDQNISVNLLDINSDSYVMFISDIETFNKLSELAKKIGCKIETV